MTDIFVAADNIFSPIGTTTAENFEQLKKGVSGVKLQDNKAIADDPFYAALFDDNEHLDNGTYTKFEQLLIASIPGALANCKVKADDKRTILIISTTKGN